MDTNVLLNCLGFRPSATLKISFLILSVRPINFEALGMNGRQFLYPFLCGLTLKIVEDDSTFVGLLCYCMNDKLVIMLKLIYDLKCVLLLCLGVNIHTSNHMGLSSNECFSYNFGPT
jgi:hypothetical protein